MDGRQVSFLRRIDLDKAIRMHMNRHPVVFGWFEYDFVLNAVTTVAEALAQHQAVPLLRPTRVI